MSTGLRPTRSDTRPQRGAKISCATENEANMAPTVAALAWKRDAYSGNSGSTTPKPTRSTATVVQIVPKPGGSGRRSPRERMASGKGGRARGVKSAASAAGARAREEPPGSGSSLVFSAR